MTQNMYVKYSGDMLVLLVLVCVSMFYCICVGKQKHKVGTKTRTISKLVLYDYVHKLLSLIVYRLQTRSSYSAMWIGKKNRKQLYMTWFHLVNIKPSINVNSSLKVVILMLVKFVYSWLHLNRITNLYWKTPC